MRKELEFIVGELVYLKISHTKGVVRFRTLDKLKQRYNTSDVLRYLRE